jgi:putative transposase
MRPREKSVARIPREVAQASVLAEPRGQPARTTRHWAARGRAQKVLQKVARRRIHIVCTLPNAASCLRLIRALAVETHENWPEAHRSLKIDDLSESTRRTTPRMAT